MRWLLAALFGCCLAGASYGQALQAIVADTNHAAGGGYVGPCDTAVAGAGGCTLFYGTRAATGAKATALTALFDWNCTGGFSGTVHSTSAGDANATELATIASNCGANDVFVAVHEQISGTANAAKSGNGLRFFNSSTTCKSLARCFYAGGTVPGWVIVSAAVSIAQPWSIASVACPVTISTNMWIAAKGSVFAAGEATTNTAGFYAGNAVVNATTTDCTSGNNPHSQQFIGNGASSIIVIDGTATTGLNAGTNTIANNFGIGGDESTQSWDGPISEVAFYPIALAAGSSAGQYGKVCNNQRLYWGTGGAC